MATRNTMNKYITLFQSSFNLEQWFSFLSDVFHLHKLNTSEWNRSSPLNEWCHIGQMVTTDNCCIGLFLHKAQDGSITNRYTELQSVTRIYQSYNIDAALSIFDYGNYWRLSFISGLKTCTLPQRESYILMQGDKHNGKRFQIRHQRL